MSLQLIREKESEIKHLEQFIYDANLRLRQLEKEKQELIKIENAQTSNDRWQIENYFSYDYFYG